MWHECITWQKEMSEAFLSLFFVCLTKTLNLTFRVELLAHHHSEHINNNDLTMCKSCTGLKNGICRTQKLSHTYPHEGGLGGAAACSLVGVSAGYLVAIPVVVQVWTFVQTFGGFSGNQILNTLVMS